MTKIKRQILELNDLYEWLSMYSTLYAKCSISDKELRVTCNGMFQILHKGQIVFKCIQPYTAIEKYNEL